MDQVKVTTVVDNYIDAMVRGTENIERFDVDQHLSHRGSPDMQECIVEAEHGVSMLVEWKRGTKDGAILYDAGWTPQVLLNNLQALEIDPRRLDGVVTSHAHIDHYGGLFGLMEQVPGIPVYTRPESFYPKFIRNQEGESLAPLNAGFTRKALRKKGRVVECDHGGTEITPGIRTTGAIPLSTDFEPPVVGTRSGTGLYRNVNGTWEDDDPPVDEQGLIIHLRDKGVVVLTGCGHTGIINTVRCAKQQFGGSPIRAIIGGFHTGNQPEDNVTRTIQALKEINPQCLSPLHCTGHHVINRLRDAFPETFVLNMVGTRLTL